MKNFRFSLQTLLEHTRDREDAQKKKLAEIQSRLQAKRAEIAVVTLEMEDLRDHSLTRSQSGATAFDIRHFNLRFASLRESQLQKQKEAAAIEKEHDACRQILIRLLKELQALDKLREKQYGEHQAEMQRQAEKEMDEFVSSRRHQAAAARG